jgi:F0F1-type ATP synthase assembly protein I
MSKLPEKKPSQPTNNKSSLQYTGMAIQMLVPIVIGFFVGMKIDNYFLLKTPICTLILGLSGIAVGIYLAIKDFIKK